MLPPTALHSPKITPWTHITLLVFLTQHRLNMAGSCHPSKITAPQHQQQNWYSQWPPTPPPFMGDPSASQCISFCRRWQRGDWEGFQSLSLFPCFLPSEPSWALLKPSCHACIPWVCPYKARANRAWKWCPWQGCADKHNPSEDRLCSPEGGLQPLHSCSPRGYYETSWGNYFKFPKGLGYLEWWRSTRLYLSLHRVWFSLSEKYRAVGILSVFREIYLYLNQLFLQIVWEEEGPPARMCLLTLKPKHDLRAKNSTEQGLDKRKWASNITVSFPFIYPDVNSHIMFTNRH